jgi:hypothetical protein
VAQYPEDNGKVQYLAWLQSSLEPLYTNGLPTEKSDEPINKIQDVVTPLI